MNKAEQFSLVQQHLGTLYPGNFQRTVTVREFLEWICKRHIDLGLGDADLASKLCSGDKHRYWQQLSEILIGHELIEAGLDLQPSHEGPDFLVSFEKKKIWIEVICPVPNGIPEDWLTFQPLKVVSMPHEEILLRWTAAIKEKAEKLLGNPVKGVKGYIEKGVVGANDAYVIAVNARLLRGPYFPSITGISQFPFAVEAAFEVGPYQINIDPKTLKAVGSGHQHRPLIRKPNGGQVPASTFLDPTFRPVSAILATDIDESWAIGNGKPMAVVYNPEAPGRRLRAARLYVRLHPDDQLLLMERAAARQMPVATYVSVLVRAAPAGPCSLAQSGVDGAQAIRRRAGRDRPQPKPADSPGSSPAGVGRTWPRGSTDDAQGMRGNA